MSDSTASLSRQITSAGDLQSVVRTMKALAASTIGQYEKSVGTLGDYYRAVELGLGAWFRENPPAVGRTKPAELAGNVKFCLGCGWALCLGAPLFTAAQTTVTWIDGTGKSNWNNSANWNSAIPGVSDTAQFDSNTAKTPNVNVNTSIGKLLFTANADAESFAGNLTLTLNSVGGLGIDNQTGLVQTFGNKFALGADQAWQSTSDGGGLTFNGTVNLAGYNLTLALAANGSSSVILGGNVSGSGSTLTIDGSGTVSLTATGSYTGATTINSGATLQIAGSGTLSSSTDMKVNAGGIYDLNGVSATISTIAGAGNIALGGATLTTGGNGSTTFSGVISDAGAGGSIDKSGSGVLTLSAANTFTGGVILNVGTIEVGHDSALGTGTLDLSGGTLTTVTNRILANDLTMSGNSRIAADSGVSLVFTSNTVTPGTNTLTLDNTANGGAHFSVGFSGSGSSFLFDRSIAFDDAATDLGLLNTTGVQTFSGVISGAGNLIRNGAGGTTLLSANNTFTGSITLIAGALQVSADNQLGGTPGVPTSDKIIFDGGALNTTASFTLNSNRGLTLNSGGGTFSPDSGTTLTYGGILAGSGGLTLSGDGSLVLSGSNANTFSGVTAINAGTLVLGKSAGNALNGNVTIGDGLGTDTLQLNGNNQIADTATVTLASSGVFAVNNQSETISGLTSLSSGAQVQLGSGSLTVANAGAKTYAGSIGGTGTLAKTAGGLLTLSGNSSAFSGQTSITSGSIALQSDSALGTSAVTVANGASLKLDGNNLAIANALSLAGTGGNGALENVAGTNAVSGSLVLAADARVQSTSGMLQLSGNIGGAGQTITFGGGGDIRVTGAIATGSGGLIKDGSGTLRLAASNSFTGTTVINAGTLVAEASQVFATSAALTLNTGATLSLNDLTQTIGSLAGGGLLDFGLGGTSSLTLTNGNGTFSGAFNGRGTIVIGLNATLRLGADFNAPNINFILAGGTLALANSTSTFGTVNITGDSVIDFGGSTSSILSLDNIVFANTGLQLTIQNWIDVQNYFYTQLFTAATPDLRGSNPTNQIQFSGFSGNDTVWQSYDHKITPVPEPPVYGLALLTSVCGLLAWRRSRGGLGWP